MKTISFIIGACTALIVVVVPVSAEASTAMWDYVPLSERADRPTTRSIQNTGRAYWNANAMLRRSFMRQLNRIEEKKDEIVPEYTLTPTPRYSTGKQGYIPFNQWRTRRHVRHLYWQNLLRIEPDVRQGEGPAGHPDYESDPT